MNSYSNSLLPMAASVHAPIKVKEDVTIEKIKQEEVELSAKRL